MNEGRVEWNNNLGQFFKAKFFLTTAKKTDNCLENEAPRAFACRGGLPLHWNQWRGPSFAANSIKPLESSVITGKGF
jgi:hypothetical protein